MNALLSANQAGMLLECRSQKVAERIKEGIWDIGIAVPPKKKGGKYTYEVNPKKLGEMVGATVDEVYEALREKRPIRGVGGRFS